MVAVFAWGWSQIRRGLTVARPVLNAGAQTVGTELLAIRTALDAGGPVSGYAALMGEHKIDGLGQAFGTKLLHFLSSDTDRALIADSITAKAFARADLPRMPSAQCTPLRYRRYIEHMRGWAAELSEDPRDGGGPIGADDLEMVLFGFNAPPGSAWALDDP